jgi:D-alanyl-lipoteichoic acid acyltransferase DltB (MBOAT superfamily)
MSLAQILTLSLGALMIGWLVPWRWRIWIVLVSSLLAIYWLQPSSPIRNIDFWLPTTSVALTVFVWAATQSQRSAKASRLVATGIVIVATILAIGLTRYLEPLCCLTPSRPPDLLRLGLGMAVAAGFIALPYLLPARGRFFSWLSLLLILTIFVILKTPALAYRFSEMLRAWTGQPIDLANAADLPWLGFSFLAFRLLHVLRDYQAGKLPAYSLESFVAYAIFFPSYISGPIDRSQRWIGELQDNLAQSPGSKVERERRATNTVAGLQRILIGAFKKFVLADSLALFALSPQNAAQTTGSLWMWVLLLGYTLRIYFDFSGYTDIAIGLGRLIGFHLPENFDRPYLKRNLTAFWNSWHITLAQWLRAYVFNPLTRALRMKSRKLPTWLIILIGQGCTMALIGLWHGITWNFLIWGLWHGLGLFVHNRWSEWSRARLEISPQQSPIGAVIGFGSWLATFLFVALGWVWFALPDPELAALVFRRLFGFSSPGF